MFHVIKVNININKIHLKNPWNVSTWEYLVFSIIVFHVNTKLPRRPSQNTENVCFNTQVKYHYNWCVYKATTTRTTK